MTGRGPVLLSREEFFGVEGAGGGVFVFEENVDVAVVGEKAVDAGGDFRALLLGIVVFSQADVNEA
jgi:hypothetical protein